MTQSPDLTPREVDVLRLTAGGLTNAAIGRKLGMSPFTAKQHKVEIFRKLNVHTGAQAVAVAYERGILGSGPLPPAEDLAMLQLARELGCRIALVRLEDA